MNPPGDSRPGWVRSEPPVLERVGNYWLYALSSRGEAAAPGYWAGFRLVGATGAGPPVLTVLQAWAYARAVFLFCGTDPTGDPAGFIEAVDKAAGTEARILWIADPAKPAADWFVHRLVARPASAGWWEVIQPALFTQGEYTLTVTSGTWLRPYPDDGPAAGFQFSPTPALTVGDTQFLTPNPMGFIPLTGAGLGAWDTTLSLSGAPTDPDGMTKLGVQLRYALPDPDDTTGRAVRRIPMPVLRQGDSSYTGFLTYDPLHPLLPARTALRFFHPEDTPDLPPLDTTLRTPLGHPLLLKPVRPAAPLRPAGFVFCVSPARTDPADPGLDYYLAPDGAFQLTTAAGPGEKRLALGLSGTEYAGFPGASVTCHFVAGQPAFAGKNGILTDAGTTAYLDLLPVEAGAEPLVYFAQPKRAPWFAASSPDADGFIRAQQLPTARLPAWPTSESGAGKGIPVGCYAGVTASDSEAAAWLEEAVLAPARRAAITGPAPGGPAVAVVTPQGMLAIAAAGGAGWDKLVLAAFPDAAVPEGLRELALTGVSPVMRGALSTSELFMVIADPGLLLGNASVRYRLDLAGLAQLRLDGVPREVVDELTKLLAPGYPTFDSEQQFVERIAPVARDWLDKILPVAGQLKMTLDGWTFQLSPRSWRTGGKAPTIMLIKFCDRPIADLVAEPAAWTWPEAAGDVAATQQVLSDLIAATENAPAGSPDGRFYREVATAPRWSGVLFLNAPIVASELPDELRFIAAGINEEEFYAHHIGFGSTTFKVGGAPVTFSPTAAFGLVHYYDPTELAPTTTVPFAFVTQRLQVRFAGSAVADVSARVQLFVNELFGSRLTRTSTVTGNGLTLTGSYQRQDGAPGYRFALERKAVYLTEAAALDSVEVLGVSVRTQRSQPGDPLVSVEFALGGNLRFGRMPYFDLFSYGAQPAAPEGQQPADGYLRFDELVVTMVCPAGQPGDQKFTVNEGRLRIDAASSIPRDGSLAAAFPVEVTGVVAAVPGTSTKAGTGEDADSGLRPEDLGYAPVLAPIDQVPMQPPWYGLTMRLDLGSLGAMANNAGLSATLLAAWMPGAADSGQPPVYCGLRLATAGAIDAGWPVQGVLRVGFRGFEFLVDHGGESPAYLLRLRRLALSVLGWSFPPGQTDVLVFGDPKTPQATSVGWYGAYSGPEDPEPDPDRARRAWLARRRAHRDGPRRVTRTRGES